MSRIVVCGAGGFIGGHLVKRLKKDGHTVIGIDYKYPEYEKSAADEMHIHDLRDLIPMDYRFKDVDEVYQLAAEVGGLGYIMDRANDAKILHSSMLINLQVLDTCRHNKVPKIFFASSACVYQDCGAELDGCKEDEFITVPDNAYAQEKLFAEKLYEAYARNHDIQVRIGRFHNCYGPFGCYNNGREKAPAALIRKVVEANPNQPGKDVVEIWGDGSATRSFMYVDDAVEGAIRLMASDFQGPVNIGSSRLVSIRTLAEMIATIGQKMLTIKSVDGPVGVQGRNSDNNLIKEKLGWEPAYPLELGLVHTYKWVFDQLKRERKAAQILA